MQNYKLYYLLLKRPHVDKETVCKARNVYTLFEPDSMGHGVVTYYNMVHCLFKLLYAMVTVYKISLFNALVNATTYCLGVMKG